MNIASAVVINLDRRPDRLAGVTAAWANARMPVPLLRHPATDLPVPYGPLGCYLSHLDVLSAGHPGPLLVLEDDARLVDGFAAALDAVVPPAGWDVLLLGGRHLAPPRPVGPGVVEPVWALESHAYVVANPAATARALTVGVLRGDLHFDLLLGRADLALYAVAPFLAWQCPHAGSDVTGRRHTAAIVTGGSYAGV